MPNNYYFKLSDFATVKEAESRLIQNTAFENGWRWVGSGKKYFQVTDPYIGFYVDDKTMTQGFGNHYEGANAQELSRLDSVLNILKSNPEAEHSEFKPDVWIAKKKDQWSDQKYQLIKECKVRGKYLHWDCYHDTKMSEGNYTRTWGLDDIRVATDAEVRDYLVEIAKKKYPAGTKVESVKSNHTAVIKDYDMREYMHLCVGKYLEYDGIYIYDAHTDKWGKVITEPAQKIGSHEVKYEKYYISVGCLKKDVEQWKNLQHVMEEFNLQKIIHVSGTIAYRAEIDTLLKGYDNVKAKL